MVAWQATVVARLSGSRELAIPPVIISAASSLKFIAGFSAHHMYHRGKALPAKINLAKVVLF